MINSVPFRNFTWSLRRYRMWQHCPREYYFHYCAAIGGHDPDTASRYQCELHAARNRMENLTYCHRLLFQEIRREFYAPVGEETELPPSWGSLYGRLLRTLEREFYAMLNHAPERDHQLPMLLDLTLPGSEIEVLRHELKLTLQNLAAQAEKNLLPRLRAIPVEYRRNCHFPQRVALGELTVHLLPVALWIEQGEFHIVSPAPRPEELGQGALFNLYLAQNLNSCPPHRVRQHFFESDTGQLFTLDAPPEISGELRRLRQNLNAVWSCYCPDGSAELTQFSPHHQADCGRCRFRLFCRGLDNENG